MPTTIPTQFLLATFETLTRRGIDVPAALRAAGVAPEASAASTGDISPDQVTALIREIWRQTGDELVGIGPRRVPRGSLRLAGLTIVHTRDLRSALSRMLELLEVLGGARTVLTVDDATGLVRLRGDEPEGTRIDPIFAFSAVGGLQKFAGWLIGSPLPLSRLAFPFDGSHLADDYETIFGVRPDFGTGNVEVEFDASYLDRPVVRSEADLKELLRDAPGSLIRPSGPPTLSSRVQSVLSRNPDGVRMPAEDLARRLAMSAPHMRRILRSEGTSVREIQDDILRDRAVDALVHGDEPIAEIAERLGFSEPSAFRRAFHRWTGVAPRDYRTGARLP